MIDRILALGSIFDWLTPLWVLIRDFEHHPVVGFVVPMNAGWTPPMLRDLLNPHGIKVIGLTLFGSNLMFSVGAAQAGYAQYLLERERVPFRGGTSPSALKLQPSMSDSSKLTARDMNHTQKQQSLGFSLEDVRGLVDELDKALSGSRHRR